MMEYKAEKISASVTPLRFTDACIGCGSCVEVCQCDVMILPESGAHPVVLYPGECWYCGSCVMACPVNAISLHHPLMNETAFTDVIKGSNDED